MNRMKKWMEKISSKSNIVIVLLGIILFVVVIFIYNNQGNKITILIACIACGLLQIVQALKFMKDPKRKTSAMTYLMMGILVIVVGFLIVGLS